MSEGNTTSEFLKQRFPTLAGSPEVMRAAKRTKGRTGAEVPREPVALIQNYLDRFREIIERDEPQKRTRGITALKKVLVDRYVVRVEDIPDSYWQAQMRVVRSRGQLGDWQDLSEDEILKIKQEHLAQTKEDQKGSLEEWIDYLVSGKSSYIPDYLKYWVFQGMLRLERYEKGEGGKPGRFPERPTGRQRSAKMFPEVNERGLKFIASAYDTKSKNQAIHFPYEIPPSAREVFLKDLEKKDFRSLYGWGQEYIPPISEGEMHTTEGRWITYAQGSEATALTKTLQGKGSGWCIVGENVAKDYLRNGDLSIYYTRDMQGNSTIPRVVVVSQGSRVTEVRGIEWEENVDGYIKETNIIGDKLKELPGGEQFFETDADTKRLTAIDCKQTSGTALNKDELTFLYELDRSIKYFGYRKDPRITELRFARNADEDITIVFGCTPDQIAHGISEIGLDTKAYVGPLERGIFDRLEGIEHIYTSFPEGRIRIDEDELKGKSKVELMRDLDYEKINYPYAKAMIESHEFTVSPPETIITVRLKVADLGLKNGGTTAEIIGTKDDVDEHGNPAPFTKGKMTDMGLVLCPDDFGIYRRLKDSTQPLDDYYWIAMRPIADRGGYPRVFGLHRREDGLWLHGYWAEPDLGWDPEGVVVFRLRKFETQTLKSPGIFGRILKLIL